MDKSWMKKNRLSKEYEVGVQTFIEFGLSHANGSNSIRCPCLKCGNLICKDIAIVRDHLYSNGIDQSYKVWFWHGEDLGNIPAEQTYNNDALESDEDDLDFFEDVATREEVLELYPFEYDRSIPIVLRCLLREMKICKSQVILPVTNDVFGCTRIYRVWTDIVQTFYEMKSITDPCIDAYIIYLYKKLVTKGASHMYKFLDAGSISTSNLSKEGRTENLTKQLMQMESGQLLLAPYNSGSHWILIVIDYSKTMVYSINPLRNRLDNDIMDVVNRALNKCNKVKVHWKCVKCQQPGSTECGYYVMRFMRAIVNQQSTSITDVMKLESKEYTKDNINVLRMEWAEFVGSYLTFS